MSLSKAEHAANRKADEIFSELLQRVTNDAQFRKEAYEFVKTAKGAYRIARILMMFAFMEYNSQKGKKRPKADAVRSLMMSAKCVLYQHFMLNAPKYGLAKKVKKSRS